MTTSTHPFNSRLAIFASGNGTNAERIIQTFQTHPSIRVVGLLSNNAEAYALKRAKKFNVPALVFDRKQFRESPAVLDWLKEKQVTHIVLAGFMWLIPEYLIQTYPDKIINIHPALLPKYGGKGMYGMHVHEAVKAAGEKETGITIHLVNERYDEGEVILQAKTSIGHSDTPDDIAHKVHQLEYELYPATIEKWCFKAKD